MDPNDVSEYLDNVLPSEQINDVEKQALESDVHLAEISACHQILTLVLGEPALVPPKSKERMYTIVQGRETIPYRKAERVKPDATITSEEEASLALSMGWLRWVLPVAGVLLVAALGLAIYEILPPRDNRQVVDHSVKVPDDSDTGKPKDPEKSSSKGSSESKDDIGTRPANKDKTTDKDKEIDKTPKDGDTRPVVEVERALPPSTKRVAVGNYVGTTDKLPTALVTRPEDKGEWQMVKAGTSVYTRDTYTALPGFVGVLMTKTGVGLLLRGHVRDFTLALVQDNLMESAVVLHDNDKFDLDLTLLRGRIFLRNQKDTGACKIRLRFESEIWDVALNNKGDEVVIDLSRTFTPVINYRAGEAPDAKCYVAFLRGDAELKIDAYHTHNIEVEPRKWVRMEYDSSRKTTGPFKEESVPAITSKQPPEPSLFPESRRASLQKMNAALNDLQVLLSTKKSPVVALQETLDKTDPASRLLAVYCLAALDEVGKLIDVVGDGDVNHWADREAAFYSLQRWVSRSATQAKLLYEEKDGNATGVLLDKKFKKREAERILTLLHPLLAEELGKPVVYQDLAADLESSRIAIAEMAFWHLVWLSPGVKLPMGFNAAASIDERERYSGEIQKMIDKKLLPPTPPPPPVAPPEKKG